MKTMLVIAAAVVLAARQDDALLKELPKAKTSLVDGIKQLTKGDEVPISGKFELEEGKLSLSVYTAEKGLGADAEHNVLKEFAGSPEGATWKPGAEVFKDVEHVSRAAAQLTILSMTKVTLLDVIARAERDGKGAVYSISPALRDRKPVFKVLVAAGSKSAELWYDATTGDIAK